MWTSQTRRFPVDELRLLETMTADQLADALLSADPVVILRGLAEVMLNEDNDKLHALLSNDPLWEKCQSYGNDLQVDARDHEYAQRLRSIKTALV